MPVLQGIYEEYSEQGLQVYAISIDQARTKRRVQPFLEQAGYTFPVLLDPNAETARPLRVSSIPQTFLFGADGKLIFHGVGYGPGSEKQLVSAIQKNLPESEGI